VSRHRPNVLFVTVDQWRGDCLGLLGHPAVRTPTLDRLAADGVAFAHHYAQATPCGPSRASLWTGLYLHNHRSVFNGTPLADRLPNLAREARALGYDPVLFGYTDTAVDPRTVADDTDPRLRSYEGVLPGFRVGQLLLEDREPWLAWLRELGYDVPETLEEWLRPLGEHLDSLGRAATAAPAPFAAEHTETAFLTDRVLEHLAGVGDDPWFVHVAYIRPHPPFVAPAPFHQLVDPADVTLPARLASREDERSLHPVLGPLHDFAAAPDDEAGLRQLRATYHGMQAEVDDQLGRLLGWLEDAGAAEATIVVVTSDHGEQLGDHGLVGKISPFRPSFHVPLVIRAPGLDAGRGTVVRRFTEHVDLRPTVLDLLGARPDGHCDGRSLRPFLDGAEPDGWRDAAHWELDYRVFGSLAGRSDLEGAWLAVRHDEDAALVHFGEFPPLLFDNRDDPNWFVDRSRDPAWQAILLDRTQRMLTWRMRHADSTLANQLITARGPRDLARRR
jgi:arylsulfatase A-like enzyme